MQGWNRGRQALAFGLLLWLLAGCQAAPVAAPREGLPGGGGEEAGGLGPQSSRAQGEQRVLVLAVRFRDVEPKVSLDQIRERAIPRLNDYVRNQSYGQAWMAPHFVTGWVPLPGDLDEYRVSPDNFKVDRARVRRLIEDAMSAVEGQVDFSRYDHLLIIPGVFTLPGKGYGMICYCANPGMLTGVRGNPRYVTLSARGGQKFSGGVFVATENAHLGMFAHDFLHALGGVHEGKRLVP